MRVHQAATGGPITRLLLISLHQASLPEHGTQTRHVNGTQSPDSLSESQVEKKKSYAVLHQKGRRTRHRSDRLIRLCRPELNVSYPRRKGWRGVFIIRVLQTQTRVRASARVTKGLSLLGSLKEAFENYAPWASRLPARRRPRRPWRRPWFVGVVRLPFIFLYAF